MKDIKRVFGLHFDFHADDKTEIGANTCAEDIEKYIMDAKPDFIQCDCKGHPGVCSYPTKVGTAGNIVKDNLRIWADTCKKHNVPLFVHYSGVMDCRYVANHPDQADVDINGGHYDNTTTSVFGDYAEKLLIPQMKELIEEYGIAGAWIDGEIWAVHRDYSELAKPFLWEGITPEEHARVMREGFYKYVNKYTTELHEFDPDFKVISNWLYSSYAPEKPVLDVDFLSGDFQPIDSAHFVRLESRVLGVQGKKWDLMAWSFAHPGFSDKSAVQLCQEAALVLSQGGGFQMYISQNRDGSPQRYEGNWLKEVSAFVKAREMLYNKAPKAQVGILYSADSFYQKNNCFNHEGAADKLIGALNLIVDAGYTVNTVLEWQLDGIAKYDIMVIPEWEYISDINKQKLLSFAENGGNLVIIGAECCAQFLELKGEKADFKEYNAHCYTVDKNGSFATLIKNGENKAEILKLQGGNGGIYSFHDTRNKVSSAYRIDDSGKGKIAYIPFDFGSLYFDKRNFVYKNLITEILSELCEKYIVTNDFIDIIMQDSEEGTYLNLINMQQGRHSLVYETFDVIPCMHNVEITVNAVLSDVSAPLDDKFTWITDGKITKIYLEKLKIHTVFLLKD